MINDRRQLADVYQQTIDIVQEGHYTSENGEEVKLPDNTKMLKGSRFYTKPLDASNKKHFILSGRASQRSTSCFVSYK